MDKKEFVEAKKYLREFGFKENDIDVIVKTYPICVLLDETLLEHCRNNNNFLLENNYTKEEVIKTVKNYPVIYSNSHECMKNKITDMVELGYTKNDFIKMAKSIPQIYSLGIENIKQKINDMMELGYTKEEIIKMTKSHPAIFSYDIENMKKKIIDIMNLGYSIEEVIKMTVSLPTLFGLSIENISEKIKYLKKINLQYVAVVKPKYLMQSVDLTYARYEFLKDQNIIVDINNYYNLFRSNEQFYTKFGIEKEELLQKYNYKRNKIKQILIRNHLKYQTN